MTARENVEAVIEGWLREAEMYVAQAAYLKDEEAEDARIASKLLTLCAQELREVLNKNDDLRDRNRCYLTGPHAKHPWTHPATLKTWDCPGKNGVNQ